MTTNALVSALALCRAAGLQVVTATSAPDNRRVVTVRVMPFAADPRTKIDRMEQAAVTQGDCLFGITFEATPGTPTSVFRFELLGGAE